MSTVVVVEEIVQEAIVQPGARQTVIVQEEPPTLVVVKEENQTVVVEQDRIGSVLVKNIVAVEREDLTSDILLQMDCLAGDPITSMGFVADSSNPSRDYARVAGIAETDGKAGFIVQVRTNGQAHHGWNWTRGDQIFLLGSTLVANSFPNLGFLVHFGTASAADTIVLEILQILL